MTNMVGLCDSFCWILYCSFVMMQWQLLNCHLLDQRVFLNYVLFFITLSHYKSGISPL